MAEQDVAQDGTPADIAVNVDPSFEGATITSPGARANGQTQGTAHPGSGDDPAALLRNEFSPRIASAWDKFRSTVSELHLITSAMQEEGRPPSYRVTHALGECHREFLRLRLDLIRRAESLTIPVPPLEHLGGIADLARLIDSHPIGSPLADAPATSSPAEPVAEALPVETVDSPDRIEAATVNLDSFEESPSETVDSTSATPGEGVSSPLLSGAEPAQDVPPTPEPAEWLVPEPGAEEINPTHSEPAPIVVDSPTADVTAESAPQEEHPGEAVRRASLVVIDTILKLQVRDGSDFPPLQVCQSQAHSLREQISACSASELPPDAEQLASGDHPLAGLLTVVGGIESLSDAQWAAVHASVSEAFGRPLAVAAARGRFKLAPTT